MMPSGFVLLPIFLISEIAIFMPNELKNRRIPWTTQDFLNNQIVSGEKIPGALFFHGRKTHWRDPKWRKFDTVLTKFSVCGEKGGGGFRNSC